MNTVELKTERKQQIVNFVSANVEEHDLSPTQKQISDELQIPEGALRHLISQLVDAGQLLRNPHQPRSLRPPEYAEPFQVNRDWLKRTQVETYRHLFEQDALHVANTVADQLGIPSGSVRRVTLYEWVLLAMSELLTEMVEGKVK